MAELKNISNDTSIVLCLRTISESPDWLGYSLNVFTETNKVKKSFLQLSDDGLSFDNFMQPEIPALCLGLDMILMEKIIKYTFEPIDEKDFFLAFERENDYYVVHLFTDSAVIFNSHEWKSRSEVGLRLWTNKENILAFSKQLKKEYEDLFLSKLLTTNK